MRKKSPVIIEIRETIKTGIAPPPPVRCRVFPPAKSHSSLLSWLTITVLMYSIYPWRLSVKGFFRFFFTEVGKITYASNKAGKDVYRHGNAFLPFGSRALPSGRKVTCKTVEPLRGEVLTDSSTSSEWRCWMLNVLQYGFAGLFVFLLVVLLSFCLLFLSKTLTYRNAFFGQCNFAAKLGCLGFSQTIMSQ